MCTLGRRWWRHGQMALSAGRVVVTRIAWRSAGRLHCSGDCV